jgi:hypothetical protein
MSADIKSPTGKAIYYSPKHGHIYYFVSPLYPKEANQDMENFTV